MRARRKEKQPGAWIKFRLLMWKNFLQQWRHRWQTILELVLPILTMTLVLILRSQIEPSTVTTRIYPTIPAHTLKFSTLVLGGMNLTSMSIAYSPQSQVLEDVVRRAAARLLVENVRDIIPVLIEALPNLPGVTLPPDIMLPNITIPDINWPENWPNATDIPDLSDLDMEIIINFLKDLIKVTAYNSSAELRGIYGIEDATREVIAAVEFSDEIYGATVLPSNISYSLRFPERPRQNSLYARGSRTWRTDLVFPAFEIPGPRFPYSWEGGNDPGYINEMFIALQHFISSELIANLTDSDVLNYNVHIRRYPHPEYVQDLAVEALQFLFPMFIMLSFSYTAVNIVRAVTVEKELQLKETMKIMGLPTWLHWMAWFWKQFMYLLLSSIFIIVILKVNWFSNKEGFSEYAVFTNTPWTVLFFFFLLYLICMIFFCFMLSGIFSKGSTAALFAGIIWFLTYIPAFVLAMDISMSTAVQAITCLSINSAMSYGFQLILARESTGGLQWGEFLFAPGTDSTRFVFGHVVIMMAIDCVLYMLIALYLEQVLPGPYGSPKPWYFFIQKDFWCSTNICLDVIENIKNVDDESQITKEKDPTGLSVGVSMKNLTKVYGKNVAVNNLSLNIYDDQITVLLGHNGAGKSTTISMLTGNLKVSRGTVLVAGHDMVRNTRAARASIGLCPQHNVLFNEMTVREHLEFFARLKGFSGAELYEEIDVMIQKLELEEKRDYQSQGLSGGQKRRLSVGIALCGGAEVVLLDEPTSGMDPASRRALWDLLQQEKKGRSMILTTHFMDEADILGDRVAIMANGRLQCVGSPYFLKQHYGVGYTLVVVKKDGFDYEACTELINRYIPGITIKEDRGTEVTYSIKNQYSYIFENMLSELERNIDLLNFKNYGLVATTLEDVFMSVGSDVAPNNSDVDDVTTTTTESCGDDQLKFEFESSLEELNQKNDSITGFSLVWNHVLALWLKLWLVWTRSWPLVVLQLLVPIVLINATLGAMQYVMSFTSIIQRRKLTIAEGFTATETLLRFNGTLANSLGALAKSAYEYIFTSANINSMDLTNVKDKEIEDYYLERTADKTVIGMLRNRLLIGATFDDNSATAWFSNFGYHDVANSLSYVHEALLKVKQPNASLTVYNHPLEANYRDQSDAQIMVSFLSMQLSSGIGSSVGIVSAVFIMFYIKERMSRAKLLQKASGIRPVTMWFSAAVFDWFWFLIICISLPISCVAFQVIGLSSPLELARLYLCLMIYGAAMLPFNYLFSYVFKGPALGFVTLFFINILFGMMGSQIVDALWAPQLDVKEVGDILDGILQFFPLYSLISAVRSLNRIGLTEWSCLQGCDYLAAVLPNLSECTMEAMCQLYSQQCCLRDNSHWDWKEPGVLRYIICMLFMCILLWGVLMAAEYRLFQIFVGTKIPPPVNESSLDPDVLDESRHVERVLASGRESNSLVANSLTKYYRNHLAVDQVSFTVADKECFGLLGVNGAGKTTTFKMLMGDEQISSGDAFVSGYSVKKNITKVHENIGYCPQFDAVFGELTGRETMKFFAMLRGIRPESASSRTEILANALGFTKHLDKKVDQYSGGNKRKLSTAVALLGRTRLVFVDEPTTGVDPAAKRQVWHAIRGAQRAGRGIVLTSHSMEECEALCSRLTIMVNGRFQCIGTPQHLKNKFSQGFTLTIKLKLDESTTRLSQPLSQNQRPIDLVKEYINTNFTNPKIMEEYQGLLTYYLPDRNVAWSKMFGIMEKAKRELDIEDYSIAQTTLEQIFLQFTKYQREQS